MKGGLFCRKLKSIRKLQNQLLKNAMKADVGIIIILLGRFGMISAIIGIAVGAIGILINRSSITIQKMYNSQKQLMRISKGIDKYEKYRS